jgi:hypothetical protein
LCEKEELPSSFLSYELLLQEAQSLQKHLYFFLYRKNVAEKEKEKSTVYLFLYELPRYYNTVIIIN